MAGLDQDIRKLGGRIKEINIILMPMLVSLAGLLVWQWRKRRRNAMAMLRKGAQS
jgi:ABC-type uncharacterized transport system involved in gliding motility auxiliary subunit